MANSESSPSGIGFSPKWVVLGALILALAGGAYAAVSGWLTIPVALSDHGSPASTESNSPLHDHDAVIPVEGMSCGACAARIKGALKDIDGVEDVEVSLVERTVRVRHVADKVAVGQLVEAINTLGYRARLPANVESESDERVSDPPTDKDLAGQQVTSVTIPTDGMACEFCVKNIEGTLRALDGVKSVRVSLEEKSTQVDFIEGGVTPQRLAEVIEAQGYKAGTPSVKGNP